MTHLPPQIPRVAGEYDLKAPRDMAYVFSGAYTPLSCKIVEQVLSVLRGGGQRPKCLPGPPRSDSSLSPGRCWSGRAGRVWRRWCVCWAGMSLSPQASVWLLP